MSASPRSFGRGNADIRPLSFEVGFTRYAEGSVLVRAGHTHVLCTATIEESVPAWLKGKGQGWITSEYSMLPRATHTRTRRDREKVSGRTQEIQRLIGRALRGCVDLKALGERQVILDCDVIQADGGTRVTSITGACVALRLAIGKLAKEGKVPLSAFTGTVAAISVGMKNGEVLADLDYDEDSSCDVDMNFVMTDKNAFVEIQGTAEHAAFTREQMNAMTDSAVAALARIRGLQSEVIAKHG
ncbi:MAG: ribonuclease PH [Bdellovibrionales bacterium]|nr:ribonuclease PH [Bdellovibrionales bacterium]